MAELNERQEMFCREFVRQGVGAWAAIEAGYERKGAAVQASRLLDRPDIQARIAERRAQVTRQHVRDTDALLARLDAICELAIRDEQYHAATRIVTLQARLAGLLPERGAARAAAGDTAAAEAEAVIAVAAETIAPDTEPHPAGDTPADPAPCPDGTGDAPPACQYGAGRIFNVPGRPRHRAAGTDAPATEDTAGDALPAPEPFPAPPVSPPGMLSNVNRCLSPRHYSDGSPRPRGQGKDPHLMRFEDDGWFEGDSHPESAADRF